MRILFVIALGLVWPAWGEPVRDIQWSDLLPKEEATFDDPFAKLSEEQLNALSMIARIRRLIETERSSSDGLNAAEEKRLAAKLTGEGLDVDWLLSQRQRVAEQRRNRGEAVDAGVDGKTVRLPGYVLPLKWGETGVTEFLLVPWVGACIHTPPPPPNQMVHVSIPSGTEDQGRFAAFWIEGKIRLQPATYDLFLVDGTRPVNVAYTMTMESLIPYSSTASDVLKKVALPAQAMAGHPWWQRLQTQISILFTQSMTDIRDRESSGPLWIGLLIAFAYGIVHTLGPGHGKTVVISYFAGEGGSLRRGVTMGTQIAVFHVLSAVIIVWITDFAVRQATGHAPSDYWLVKLVSYASIALLGAIMLWKAIQGTRLRHDHGTEVKEGHSQAGHPHHDHRGCHACAAATGRSGLSGWLALAVGSVPCTGALLVLLFGMANNLLVPAILMVVAISTGMAVAMSGIGVLAIAGRNWVDRKLDDQPRRHERFVHGIRIAAASVVMLIGTGLFTLTLAQNSEPRPSTANTVALE